MPTIRVREWKLENKNLQPSFKSKTKKQNVSRSPDVLLLCVFQGTSTIFPLFPMAMVMGAAIMVALKSPSHVFESHPCLYLLAFGILIAKVTNRLVVSVGVCVCVCVCVCMYACVCVCVCVCMYACVDM